MIHFKTLSYDIEGYIGRIVLNHPPVNALGKNLVAEIILVLDQVMKDIDKKKIRSVVLSAEGKHFCAGADLKERQETPTEQVEGIVASLREAINYFAEIPVPTIAAVQGNAIGGGLELALAADIRVFSETTRVGLREVALGIIPGAGGTQRLPKIIGYSKTIYWITSARIFEARQAFEQGVANFLVSENELKEKAFDIAREISKNGPLAVQLAKKAIQASYDFHQAEGLYQEFEQYKKIIHTKDRLEGLKAFIEKREPKFQGD